MSNQPKYIVIDEDILGVREKSYLKGYTNFGILRAKPHRYMGDPCPGSDSAANDRIRPATEQDFADYRVSLPPDFREVAQTV